jgi:beta-lactamase regulating signal transducer with metallopeptidase domain
MNELLVSVAETGPSLAIRATALFAVASGVALALGKASAAQRHLVWAAALAASLVLPVMHVCAPEWGVLPAFTAKHTSSPAMREAPMAGESPSASIAVASFHESPRGAERAASAAVSPPASPASPAPPKAAAFAVSVSPGQVLAVLWLTGVLLGCVRLALAGGRIRQLARRADPATGRMAALLAELARETGIRRPVRGLVSRQSIVPMTWGWLRPVVLLPADAASWSAARLRVVLLHELAHVRRGDAATQFVAELARSLYWFHPLSWWGVRCLRVEQEAACDDRVLAAGAAAEDYADELVAVTARLPHGLQAAGLAVAMGRRHTIESRVRSILADDRDRRPVRMVRAAVIGGVFAMLATVAAIVGPAADVEDAPAGSGTRPAAAELPKDTNTIESLTVEEARKLVEEFPPFTRIGSLTGSLPRHAMLPLQGLQCLDVETAKALAKFKGGGLDLSGLTTLDAESARALAGFKKRSLFEPGELRLNGLTRLDVATAEALARFPGPVLRLNGLTTLDADVATELAEFKGFMLELNGLTRLDSETARRLSRRKESLRLDGLPALGTDAAKALAEHQGHLTLKGLTTLDAATAMGLAEFKGQRLSLDGLTVLGADIAKALAGFKGDQLHLDGLTSLDATAARALAAIEGESVSLCGLTTLDADVAKALAEFKGQQLSLDGLTTLDATAARSLAAIKGESVSLSGLTTLDADAAQSLVRSTKWTPSLMNLPSLDAATAKALAAFKGRFLTLHGLTTLDAATAQALAEFKGERLALSGLASLDAATATILARFKGEELGLSGLKALDESTAAALATFQGDDANPRFGVLYLDGLKTIDASTAAALARFKASQRFCNGELRLNGLTAIDADAATALAAFKGHGLHLNGLTTLDADTAAALAAFPGAELYLHGLTSLDAAATTAIARFKGVNLGLNGLATLDVDAARAIAACETQCLDLCGLAVLDPDAAQALAKSKAKLLQFSERLQEESFARSPLTPATAPVWAELSWGIMSGITAFESPDSVAIAKALATRKGPLSLPNLKKISPKTLSALIEKDDIDIPLIETLELIPEPDGSPTEDFVIPERFQKR